MDKDPKVLKIYSKRFCPEINKIADYFQIKNAYANTTERISFSVEIVKCNPEFSQTCKSDETVQKFLDVVYFTMYNIEEVVDFKNNHKVGSRPVRTTNKFHSQF